MMVRTVRHVFTRGLAAMIMAAVVAVGLLGQTAAAHPRPKPPKPVTTGYVALGDSYAAGEGLAPFEEGTAGVGECHRSADASYPVLLNDSGRREFRRLDSVACSGAIIADLVATRPGTSRPPQVAAVDARTRTITATIGGNDAGFGLIFGDCVYSPDPTLGAALPGRPGCSLRDDTLVSTRIAALAGGPGAPVVPGVVPLPVALKQLDAAAPRATIYLTGYPAIFGSRITSPYGCQVSDQAPLFVATQDAAWIAGKAAELNAAIRSAAAQARRAGVDVRYVDAAAAFRRHNLCDRKAAWLNGVVLASVNPPQLSAATFHPTARGQRAYAEAVSRLSR